MHSPIQANDGAPPQDKQYINIKITPEFEDALKDFEYISKETLQEELVEVLRRSDAEKQRHMDPKDDPGPGPYPVPDDGKRCWGKCELM